MYAPRLTLMLIALMTWTNSRAAIVSVSNVNGAGAQAGGTTPLFPICVGAKWGYIGPSGKLVIPFQFAQASDFQEGLAAVTVDDKRGYIDLTGALTIKPQFEDGSDFAEGFAPVKSDGKWGFINRDGAWVVSPQFDSAHSFSEALAVVGSAGKWGYINAEGKVVIPLQFAEAADFHEGRAAVAFQKGGPTGYIDKSGKLIIPARYSFAEQYSEERAMVIANHQINFIDKTGHRVIQVGRVPRLPASLGVFFVDMIFRENLCAAPFGQRWGYIDHKGQRIIPPQFALASPFFEGLAAVAFPGRANGSRDGDSPTLRLDKNAIFIGGAGGALWGYIDHSGKVVIPPGYDVAGNFQNGLAHVTKNGQVGYINHQGVYVWEPPK